MAQTSAAAPAQGKPKKQKQSPYSGMSKALIRRETISAYCFLIPSLIFFVTFVVVPMFICVFYSFTEYGLGGVKGFAGLENYVKLFQDPIFHKGFLNTVLIVVVAVPTVTAFSLWVSSAIYKMHAIPRSFFRCVFYLPVVTGSVAITVPVLLPVRVLPAGGHRLGGHHRGVEVDSGPLQRHPQPGGRNLRL